MAQSCKPLFILIVLPHFSLHCALSAHLWVGEIEEPRCLRKRISPKAGLFQELPGMMEHSHPLLLQSQSYTPFPAPCIRPPLWSQGGKEQCHGPTFSLSRLLGSCVPSKLHGGNSHFVSMSTAIAIGLCMRHRRLIAYSLHKCTFPP